MKSNWDIIELGNALQIPIRNGLTKPKSVRGKGYKMINMGEIFKYSRIYNVDMDLVPLSEKEKNLSAVLVNDLLFARQSLVLEGAGKCVIVKAVDDLTVFESHIIRMRLDEATLNSDFIYYYFNSYYGRRNMEGIVEQVAAAGIRGSDLVKLKVPCPPLEIQKQIAKILSSIDDKIELNNKINDNLEHQALMIYQDMISNSLEIGTLGDYCNVKSGFAFKSAWWTQSGVKVIKIKNIDNDKLSLVDCSFVSEDKIQVASDFVAKSGDLIIAMTGATIGKFTLIPKLDETLLINQRVGKFFLGNNPLEKVPFLYCTLKQKDVISEIINRGQGSAQPNISASDILTTSCFMPNTTVINNFNLICKPIFESIIENQMQNQKLAQLRDTLLPKLMSGEIDVSEVEI